MYKHLKFRLFLIIFLVLFFIPLVFPYKDTRILRKAVRDTYINDRVDLKRRVPVPGTEEILSWPAYLTSFAHNLEEVETRLIKEETVEGFLVREREVVVISKGLNYGLDLWGGAELRYRVAEGSFDRYESADSVVRIIRRRIDAYGLREPIIQKQGGDRILVQLPGKDRGDIDRIKGIIEGTGHLEFRLVASKEEILEQWKAGDVPEGYRSYTVEGAEQPLLVNDNVEFTGEYIAGAGVIPSDVGQPIVSLRLNQEGRRKFEKVTGNNIGERLAIVLNDERDASGKIVNQGKLYSAPVIKMKIFGDATIEGNFTKEDAEDLATTLMAGALPAKLIKEQEFTVGPTLGEDTIRRGITAVQVGLALVLIFMVVYYLLCGLIANVALCMNLLVILAILAAFRATLTLPGLAGLILTAGMAVDANVLIFERMREEMRKKKDKPLYGVLRDGYGRAFWTIFDANLTTIITALILWWWGTGPVKGFGITLTIGIASSMFTALFVTRAIFELLLKKKLIKKFRMLSIVGETDIPFLKLSRYAMVISAVVIMIGIGAFVSRGRSNYGIDFTGGDLVQVALKKPLPIVDMKERIADLGYDAVVQSVGVIGEAEKKDEGSLQYEVRSSYLPTITWVKRAETIPLGTDKRFGGGLAAEIEIDRSVSQSEILSRMLRNYPDTEVTGKGQEDGSGRFSAFEIKSNTTHPPDSYDNAIEEAFRQETLTSDLREILAGYLRPESFGRVEREDGKASVEMNLSVSLDPAEVVGKMKEQGYDVTASSVGDGDGASSSFVVTAEGTDPSALQTALLQAFKKDLSDPFPEVVQIGASIARGIRLSALFLTVMAWLVMICYIWFRFQRLRWGVAAVIALVHDVLITVGFLALTGRTINMPIVAALLTIIGYSINDTIVVFDRVRENRRLRRDTLSSLINVSINQTLSRTILTSLTVLVVVVALFVWGGSSINDFAFAMIVGVLAGTYSSVFIAAPILSFGQNNMKK